MGEFENVESVSCNKEDGEFRCTIKMDDGGREEEVTVDEYNHHHPSYMGSHGSTLYEGDGRCTSFTMDTGESGEYDPRDVLSCRKED